MAHAPELGRETGTLVEVKKRALNIHLGRRVEQWFIDLVQADVPFRWVRRGKMMAFFRKQKAPSGNSCAWYTQ